MKLSRLALTAILAVSLAPGAASAQTAAARTRVTRAAKRGDAATKAAAATAGTTFSVEVPYVRSYAPPGAGQSADLVLNQAHSFKVSLVATDQHHNNVTGAGVALIGDWFGTGDGRGMALAFIIAAFVGLVVTVLAMYSRSYRLLSAEYQKP